MTPPPEPSWLEWSRKLQAIAQNGLCYSENPYDHERYEAIRGIAAQMMAAGSGEPIEVVTGLFASQTGYATPKVDVRGVVFRDEQILLVREAQDGLWTLPGGWADPNESPSESVTREIFEEAGFTTRAIKLIAVFDRAKHAHTPLDPFTFTSFLSGVKSSPANPAQALETLEVAFFPENGIPNLSIHRTAPSRSPAVSSICATRSGPRISIEVGPIGHRDYIMEALFSLWHCALARIIFATRRFSGKRYGSFLLSPRGEGILIMNIIDTIQQEQIKKDVTSFKVGDSVRVHTRVIEGDKERIQIFTGIVIGRKGTGLNANFTVRRISYGEGVERVFPVNSPAHRQDRSRDSRHRPALEAQLPARPQGQAGNGCPRITAPLPPPCAARSNMRMRCARAGSG